MSYTFVKLIPGEIVSTNGTLAFKELVTRLTRPQECQIDLSTLDLPPGTHTITARAVANGVVSEPSNAVTYSH